MVEGWKVEVGKLNVEGRQQTFNLQLANLKPVPTTGVGRRKTTL